MGPKIKTWHLPAGPTTTQGQLYSQQFLSTNIL